MADETPLTRVSAESESSLAQRRSLTADDPAGAVAGLSPSRTDPAPLGNGRYRILTHTGKCLDVENASTVVGARIVPASCGSVADSPSQLFDIERIGSGQYRVTSLSGMCLDRRSITPPLPAYNIIQTACRAANPYQKHLINSATSKVRSVDNLCFAAPGPAILLYACSTERNQTFSFQVVQQGA
ncbi:RICIN domain-containing protein [Streptomyces sp. NPDC057638]|uniref:RICIN domain-containing protein n=1 Tax=Streptomyces sp. NPDC057638 TaxID=3346190 RepID=UPI00369E820E